MKLVQRTFVIAIAALFVGHAQAQSTSGATSAVTSSGAAQAGGGTAALQYAPVSNYAGQDRTAGTAYSGTLVAGFNTCLGSVVGAVQTVVVGVSGGSTTPDDPCNLRSDSGQLFQIGLHAAAFARLCSKPENEYAIDVSGGIPYTRDDGAVVKRRCPMSYAAWVDAGKPLLDPVTGQAYVEPARVVPAAPVDKNVAAIEARAAKLASLEK